MTFDENLKSLTLKIILLHHENISKNVRSNTVSILVGDSKNRLLKVQQIRYLLININKIIII